MGSIQLGGFVNWAAGSFLEGAALGLRSANMVPTNGSYPFAPPMPSRSPPAAQTPSQAGREARIHECVLCFVSLIRLHQLQLPDHVAYVLIDLIGHVTARLVDCRLRLRTRKEGQAGLFASLFSTCSHQTHRNALL